MISSSHLVVGAEQVGVILGEAAHAGHAAQFAGFLPAVDGAKLREAHRQVPVAVVVAGEDLDVVRAIHRLEQEALDVALLELVAQFRTAASFVGEPSGLPLQQGWELDSSIVREVSGGPVEVELADVGREDLLVPCLSSSPLMKFCSSLRTTAPFGFQRTSP